MGAGREAALGLRRREGGREVGRGEKERFLGRKSCCLGRRACDGMGDGRVLPGACGCVPECLAQPAIGVCGVRGLTFKTECLLSRSV